MTDDTLKYRVGRTPLLRAKGIEKDLGIRKVFLKLEGANPSKHREDRLAYLFIRDAQARGKNTICIGSYGTVGGSLSQLLKYYDMELVLFVPKRSKILREKEVLGPHVKIIEHGRTYEDCVEKSREAARENGWYDANPGLDNSVLEQYAFSYLANEINGRMEGPIDTVFAQTSNGSAVAGLHMGFKKLWVDEVASRVPRIYAVSTSHGNSIVESYNRNIREMVQLQPSDILENRLNRNLVNLNAYNGQEALNAVYDTGGRVIGISNDELMETARWMKKVENIRFNTPNIFPVAAFIKEAREGQLSDGNHVIILNDGRLDLVVERVTMDTLPIPYETFVMTLDDWLIEFSDPREEIDDALRGALEEGFVFVAFHQDRMVGIVVVSHSRYEKFFPKYHLSYIATAKHIKGRGIATQLFDHVIEATKGDFSLHVEIDNKRAIKLYEKMGLRRKYYRMFYVGDVPQ